MTEEGPPIYDKHPGGNEYTIDSNHKFNSLDILAPDTNAYLAMSYTKKDAFINWTNFLLLGLFVGIIAFGINELEEFLVKWVWEIP